MNMQYDLETMNYLMPGGYHKTHSMKEELPLVHTTQGGKELLVPICKTHKVVVRFQSKDRKETILSTHITDQRFLIVPGR